MNPSKTILIAEDDKFLVSVYKVKFGKAGFNVIVAADGEQALQVLAKQRPDLILLDLIMPVKDGFEVLKEVRANPDYKDMPIIVASNLGQEEDIKRAKLMGANDYFVKANVHLPDLVAMITKMVS